MQGFSIQVLLYKVKTRSNARPVARIMSPQLLLQAHVCQLHGQVRDLFLVCRKTDITTIHAFSWKSHGREPVRISLAGLLAYPPILNFISFVPIPLPGRLVQLTLKLLASRAVQLSAEEITAILERKVFYRQWSRLIKS
jgi:hypothetical protein